MRTPLFSRICSVRYTGLHNIRSFVLPIEEAERELIKKIETKIENDKLIVKFYVGTIDTIIKIEPVQVELK
jgi:hypothetical protein